MDTLDASHMTFWYPKPWAQSPPMYKVIGESYNLILSMTRNESAKDSRCVSSLCNEQCTLGAIHF